MATLQYCHSPTFMGQAWRRQVSNMPEWMPNFMILATGNNPDHIYGAAAAFVGE